MLIIILALTLFLIGTVSASSYVDICQSEGMGKCAKQHNANWTKTDYKWSYWGKVEKNGYIYKKYIKLYQLDCICYDKAHTEQLKLWKTKFPYHYTTITAGSNPKYKYVKYAPAKHTYKKGGYTFTVPNSLYEKITYCKKHPSSKKDIDTEVNLKGPKKKVKYKYYYPNGKWKYIYKKEKCHGEIHKSKSGKPVVSIDTYVSVDGHAEPVSKTKWTYKL